MNMKKFVRLMLLPAALIMAGSVAFAATHVVGQVIRVKDPTCSEFGLERKFTSEPQPGQDPDEDGLYFTEKLIDKLPHTWGEWKTVEEATCTTPGKKERVCTVCKEKEEEPIEPEHSFGWYPGEQPLDPCNGGTLYWKCGKCGSTEDPTRDPSEPTQMFVEGKCDPDYSKKCYDLPGAQEGTCVLDDIYGYRCKNCGKMVGELKNDGPLKDVHDYGAVQYVDKQSMPTCEKAGHGYRICNWCHETLEVDVKELGHLADMEHPVYVEMPTCHSKGVANYYCTRECCKDKQTDAEGHLVPAYAITNAVVAELPHNWSAWQERNPATPGTAEQGGSLGYWLRKCLNDNCNEQQTLFGMINGLAYDREDGKYKYYDENGEVDTDYVGMVAYGDGLFIVNKGVVDTSVNGVGLPGDTFYFFANGQVQTGKAGFAEYDGEWFVLTNEGTLNIKYNGLYEYDGGLFWVAAGQKTHYTGLQKTDRGWLYMEDGQVMEQTGLKAHDGKIFYIIDGALAEDYTGTVKDFKGTEFNVVNGMVVK